VRIRFFDLGGHTIRQQMDHHLSHVGAHDYGFFNFSTYGNVLRFD
jgi:hypothetical protein